MTPYRAVVAFNDQSAIGVLAALTRAGVSVPGEVSVAGYDDDTLARLSCFDLTTVTSASPVPRRLFGYGLRPTPASAATSLTLAEPAVAAILGVGVLGERLPTASWCGLAVLALGLVLLAVQVRTGGRGR